MTREQLIELRWLLKGWANEKQENEYRWHNVPVTEDETSIDVIISEIDKEIEKLESTL